MTSARCPPVGPSVSHWLGLDPHVPLAIVDGASIATAGTACCAPWARRGDSWRAVSAWGQIAGEVTVSGGEGYDASQCYELELTARSGTTGVGLFVRGAWAPAASAAWDAPPAARRGFEALLGQMDQLAVEPSADSTGSRELPTDQRAMYFRIATNDTPDGSTAWDDYAVGGGRLLVVAYRSRDRWVLAHVERDVSGGSFVSRDAYRPFAVLDIDGDGFPEIFVHLKEGGGEFYGDVVLGTDVRRGAWQQVAVSVGGSTA